MEYSCYLLEGAEGWTYVGITNNLPRRIRQHNREIKGGAKATAAHRPWRIYAFVSGFSNKNEAEKFEARMKYIKPRHRKIDGRVLDLQNVFRIRLIDLPELKLIFRCPSLLQLATSVIVKNKIPTHHLSADLKELFSTTDR